MGFLRNRLLRRFGPLARLADLVMVLAAALRFGQRKGWITEEQTAALGLDRLTPPVSTQKVGATGGSSLPIGEIALAAGAAWRLLRRKPQKKRRRR